MKNQTIFPENIQTILAILFILGFVGFLLFGHYAWMVLVCVALGLIVAGEEISILQRRRK